MIRYNIEKHATAFPSKVLAREGGKHIYNITLSNDRDNGNFVAKGDWIELDRYEEGIPTTFEGIVQDQASNGEYYVEVVNPGDALFVYQVPMIEEEYNNAFKLEGNFFNPGPVKDSEGKVITEGATVRCYELAPGDIVAISVEGFTAAPTIGKGVELSGNKLAEKA